MKNILTACLKAYKRHISPFFIKSCRYEPTCSEYAVQALNKFGFFRGGTLALWRILRCNPFSGGGYDPVVKK